MKIRCIQDKVLVRLDPDPSHGINPDGNGSAIEMPEGYRYHACRGVVVGVGPGVEKYIPSLRRVIVQRPDVRQGERVEIAPDVGQQFTQGGHEYRFCRESDLRLVVERD